MINHRDELENSIINNLKADFLYNHEFEDGRFFQVVHEDNGDPNSVTFKIASRTLLKVVFLNSSNGIEGFEIIKLTHGGEKQRVKLSKFNISQIKLFLSFLCELDLGAIAEKKLKLNEADQYSNDDVLNRLRNLFGDEQTSSYLEKCLDQGVFVAKDLVNTGYRRIQLKNFKELLEQPEYWRQYCTDLGINAHSEEKTWQHFFELNQWIFGYGLDYRFMSILQREANISEVDLSGSNTVIADYLLGDKMFTTFVEIKRPSTKLFHPKKNRSGSWQLSNELTWSISQILEHKAAGNIKLDRQQFLKGEPLVQKSYDSKVILILGNWSQLDGNTQEKEIKKKTFELFRRDSRNVEILTFDELYDRAKYIVDGHPDNSSFKVGDFDLPF